MSASPLAVARRFAFVRETGGPNRGAFVEFFQRFAKGAPGDSWCADFVSVVLDVAWHGKPPLGATGSTRAMLMEAEAKGLVVPGPPQPDDLYFFTRADGTPDHVGIVTLGDPLTGIAGNTSADGRSSNGTGVFEHAIPSAGTRFVRLPKGDD